MQTLGYHIHAADQIPIERDPYISITFDKDISRNSSHSVDPSGSGATPMEEDLQDPGPSDQAGASNRLDEDGFLQNIPEKEVIRDAVHDFHLAPWLDRENDVIEPDRTLEQQLINDKEILAPAAEEIRLLMSLIHTFHLCDPMSGLDMEIGGLCNYEAPIGNNILPEIVGSPNRFTRSETGFMSSPHRRDSFTPVPANNFGSQLEPQLGTTVGNEVQPAPDRTASIGTFESEMETPTTFKGRQLGLENTGLSDIPEVMNSAEANVYYVVLKCGTCFWVMLHGIT
ncbi:hypothetical protein U1Q18_050505 [Sarracenia purpurea var. burkii]